MTKKYELTDITQVLGGTTLYRIRALKNFRDVRIGDLGGWVSSPNNLSQKGDCWMYDEACMFNDSRTFDNSCMYGNSCMYDRSRMYDYSRMFDNSFMYDDSRMHDKTHAYDDFDIREYSAIKNVSLYSNAVVDSINIESNRHLHIKKTPILIPSPSLFKIIVTDDHLIIGCETFTLSQWRSFGNGEILQMTKGRVKLLKLWNLNKESIFKIAELHQTED